MDVTGNPNFEHALALLEERRFSEAVAAFTEVVALSPEFSGAYGNRGLAYLNLGLEEEAMRDFEKVLQLDPEDAMGYAMMAELSRLRGSPEETLSCVVDALELDPDEPQAHFIRGWLFAKSGQFQQAAEDFSRFLELAGENEDVTDFRDACMVLGGEFPVDEFGFHIDTQEKQNLFLGRRGWSFDMTENQDFEELGQPCAFAHCIRNCPPLSPETPDGCPVFGYACPGGRDQVSWCRENPRFFD